VNTKQMEYILELARTGNFNRAAENLYISQPTLTYQIKLAEQEIRFRLFDRSGRGAALTPAGEQFVTTLQNVMTELRIAVEQGQNFAARFQENLRLVMPIRSALYFLPQALERFEQEHPGISVTPGFDWHRGIEAFLKGEYDICFAYQGDVRHLPDVQLHPLFDSKIYLVTRQDDPLAQKTRITEQDLADRTLMVGGPSQDPLRQVQRRVVEHTGCQYFNSESHDMSLTYVASQRGIVLSPGFLNDHTGAFAWIPFDCPETLPCVLCTHKEDRRTSVWQFVALLQELYAGQPDFPC
jgi:DNA-binding transcriptional LysR family regulator